MTRWSQTRIVAMAVLIAVLAASPASSKCLFCKGGALSIDKPFNKGGTLSIDKPFDFFSKPIARAEHSANGFLDRAIAAATALLRKLVVSLGIALAAVTGFAIVLAMGLAALILRRGRRKVIETT